MKNNDSLEKNPVISQPTYYPIDSGISLVELTVMLIRRIKMIGIIIFSAVILGTITSMLIPKSYTFSTSIAIGSQIVLDTIIPFESPQTLQAKIQHAFIPQALNEQLQRNPDDKNNYKITVSIPRGSEIIILETNGTIAEAELIINILERITQLAIQDHERIYDAMKDSLIALKTQHETNLKALDSNKNNLPEKIQLLLNSIEVQDSKLANLRKTRELSPAIKSIQPTNISRQSIFIIAIISGIFLGVFSAFLAEFITKVKEVNGQSS